MTNANSADASSGRPRWSRHDAALAAAAAVLVLSSAYYYAVARAHGPIYAPPELLVKGATHDRGPLYISTMTCHGSDRLWSVREP